MSVFKSGDIVGFVFAQPGNDTTYLKITDVGEGVVDAWDLFFDQPISGVKTSKIWLASEREMQLTTRFVQGRLRGSYTVGQLAQMAQMAPGQDSKPSDSALEPH